MHDRQKILAEINTQLAAHDLPPRKKLGIHEEGEYEITGIDRIVTWEHALYADVIFNVVTPGGTEGTYVMSMHPVARAGDGMVVVMLLNGQFLFRKLYQPSMERWMVECTRMFGTRVQGDNGREMLEYFLTEELGKRLAGAATILRDVPLGVFAENSGRSSVQPFVRLVEIGVPEEVVTSECAGRKRSLMLMTRAQVWDEIGKRLYDAHSLSAILYAFKYLDANPRL